MANRNIEITKAAARDGVEGQINGRGYRTTDAPLTLAMGVGMNLVAVLILGLYVAADIYPRLPYRDPQWLWGVVILVLMWSSRIWLLSHRGAFDDDPVSFALRHRLMPLLGSAPCLFFALARL